MSGHVKAWTAALSLCAEAPPELASELLREQHAERSGHLAALCRVILGEA